MSGRPGGMVFSNVMRHVSQAITAVILLLATEQVARGSVCVADCDGDGRVQINELVVSVNVALGLFDPSTCSGADIDGDGAVAVHEIVTAVGFSLTGCEVQLSRAALDAVRSLLEALNALETIDSGVALGVPRADALFCSDADTPSEMIPGPRAESVAPPLCTFFGSVRSQCHSIDISSFFQSNYETCSDLDEDSGVIIRREGAVIATALDLGVCDPTLSELTNFRSSVSVEAVGSNGEVIEAVEHDDLVVASTPGPPVCGRWGDSALITGRIGILRRCLGENLEFDFRNFAVENQDSGDSCQPPVLVHGAIEISDRAHPRRFEVAASALTLIHPPRESPDEATRQRVGGTISSACVGAVFVETRSDLIRFVGKRCPEAGELRLTLPTGAVLVRFGSGGQITIDADSDGMPDTVLPDCGSSEISICGHEFSESRL